jgi:hypothetical protein
MPKRPMKPVALDDERQQRFKATFLPAVEPMLCGTPLLDKGNQPHTHIEGGRGVQGSFSPRPTLWGTIGRKVWGLGLIGTGAFIAVTSLQANAWFGHSLTPDPIAGEIYSRLSVAAEVVACLLPTAIGFYRADRRPLAALWGTGLMAVALVVVFFAAGGFALTNISAGLDAKAERETPAIHTALQWVEALATSRAAECSKRGPQCKRLEGEEQAALVELGALVPKRLPSGCHRPTCA